MNIHFLGIAGSFMAGLARLAVQSGHRVSGSDKEIYPPMSEQLEELGIQFYANDRLPGDAAGIEHYVVGNVMSRGMPVVEQLLDSGRPYSSGPEWLYENVLRDRRVIAVAGTHGKSTTTGMLAWMLRDSGISAGYLIGAVAENFGNSAELGSDALFVIEADEYDCAFFDKRPKFLHYRPQVLIINNIEHDHLDIYQDVADIRFAFHQLLRQLPGQAEVIVRGDDENIGKTLAMGLWSRLTRFNVADGWTVAQGEGAAEFCEGGQGRGAFTLRTDTAYNRLNALAALLGASKAGLDLGRGAAALAGFAGMRRRLQLLHESGPTRLFEDFAHHPTAIACVIEEFRRRIDRAGQGRLVLVVELGSYTMRAGHHLKRLVEVLGRADQAFVYCPSESLCNQARSRLESLPAEGAMVFSADAWEILAQARRFLRPADQVVILSNRNFQGAMPQIRQELAEAIDSLCQPKP